MNGERFEATVIDLETSDLFRLIGFPIYVVRRITVLPLLILSMADENVLSMVNFDSIEGATSGNFCTAARSRR